MQIKAGIIIPVILLATVCSAAAGKIIYVDDTATGNNDGTSWENAYIYLQEALADANDSEKPVEILVAQGTYKPDGGIVTVPEFDRRTLTFQLINGVSLKGGYAGAGSPEPNKRDMEQYKTIFSGDLDGDDIDVNDLLDLGIPWIEDPFWREPNREDNSYHIINGSNTDETALLEGFTIIAGNGHIENGGGMYNNAGSPTITNCIFIRNSAIRSGGGISCENNSNPSITNCTFILNDAFRGGGICNYDSSPTLINCKFTKNYTRNYLVPDQVPHGGAIYNNQSSSSMTNCLFIENVTNSASGGAIYNTFGSSLTLTNCTFTRNSAYWNGGSISSGNNSNLTLVNCILWNNDPNEIFEDVHSQTIVRYSNIQGGWEGVGNINEDPLFADPNSGDFHLKSQTGRYDPNSGSWIKDDVTSPCIDTGDPNSDWSSERWPHGERINMGAYGGTRQASMSTETDGMSLPHVLYIYDYNRTAKDSFGSLLEMYGISVNSVSVKNLEQVTLTDYDLIIVGDDASWSEPFKDGLFVAAVEDSGKPVLGLGDGGYDFFGELELRIGNPYGGHGGKNSIRVIDPEYSLFSTPYPIEIPDDRILQLYTETRHVGIYLWPDVPETVFVIASEPDDPGYYPLVMEHNRYMLWGFTESPEKMTPTGKKVFINTVIYTANIAR